MYARTLIRNVRARASAIIYAYYSEIILDCTYACLCVHAQASASISSHAPTSIHASDGCSAFMSIVLPKNIYTVLIDKPKTCV